MLIQESIFRVIFSTNSVVYHVGTLNIVLPHKPHLAKSHAPIASIPQNAYSRAIPVVVSDCPIVYHVSIFKMFATLYAQLTAPL
jgi:hypothetical protein